MRPHYLASQPVTSSEGLAVKDKFTGETIEEVALACPERIREGIAAASDCRDAMRRLEGHERAITACCFSPDGKTVASGSWDRAVKIWSRKTGRLKQTLATRTSCHSICFSPDSKAIVSGDACGELKLWK